MNTIGMTDLPEGAVGGISGTREIDSITTDVRITKCKLTKVINKAQKGDLVSKKASLNIINQFYDDLKKLHYELIHKVASNQSGDENVDSFMSDTMDYEDEVFANIMALKLDVEEANGEGSKTTVVESPTESGIQDQCLALNLWKLQLLLLLTTNLIHIIFLYLKLASLTHFRLCLILLLIRNSLISNLI